jgi:hypothetical protein
MRYLVNGIGIALYALVAGGVLAFVVYHLGPVTIRAFAPPHSIVVMRDLPGPFSGWPSFWLWLSPLLVLLALPKAFLSDRRIRRRSRILGAFVLWRIGGLYELHGPEGGVVPVGGFGLRTWIRPGQVHVARIVAARRIQGLTGRKVARWEPDKLPRSAHYSAAWIARLESETDPEQDTASEE